MKSYLISCDLKGPSPNYAGLVEAMKKFPLSWRHIDPSWIVRTDWSAKQVRDHVKPHIGATDGLLVLELTGEGAWTGLGDEAVNWLVENL
jgi:hypothetical protein